MSGRIKNSILSLVRNAEDVNEASQEAWHQIQQLQQISQDSKNHISNIYGTVIAKAYGSVKLTGKVIWAAHSLEPEKVTAALNSNVAIIHVAVAICEGVVHSIDDVWIDGKQVMLCDYDYEFYTGGEAQEPSQTMLKYDLRMPGHRGLAYIVFKNLTFENFTGKIPHFAFKVTMLHRMEKHSSPDDIASFFKHVVVGPGYGEFLYNINKVALRSSSTGNTNLAIVNSHNYINRSNALYSFERLQMQAPALKWVMVEVHWFVSSLDIKDVVVAPRVEIKKYGHYTTEEWQVAEYTRNNAELCLHNQQEQPIFGGTPTDKGLIPYLQTLKAKGMKIVIAPIITVDLKTIPHRREISGSASDIERFFNGAGGYAKFIKHYAKLCKDYAQCFLIGSELTSIMSIKDAQGSYPAVMQMKRLAADVKRLLKSTTLISYAAGHKEYHNHDGNYPLDELWMDENINFVGINAFFSLSEHKIDIVKNEATAAHVDVSAFAKNPLSSVAGARARVIGASSLKEGWQSGVGYDYEIDEHGSKSALQEQYAYKNIEYWWRNEHYDLRGQKTSWQPQCKKIWFLNFGMPSCEGAAYAPSEFNLSKIPYDAQCDYSLQKNAILSSFNHYYKSEYVERIFVYFWDMRGDRSIFTKDQGGLAFWEYGFSVNDKIFAPTLSYVSNHLLNLVGGDLVKAPLQQSGITGMLIERNFSIKQIMNQLRCVYFFDMKYAQDKITFCDGHTKNNIIAIDASDILIFKEDGAAQVSGSHGAPQEYSSNLHLYFTNHHTAMIDYCYYSHDMQQNNAAAVVHLPIMAQKNEAMLMAAKLVNDELTALDTISFKMDMRFLHLEVGDVIEVMRNNFNITPVRAKIVKILMKADSLLIHARRC